MLIDMLTKMIHRFNEKFFPYNIIRPTILQVKKQGKENLIGAEIGVSIGDNAKNILCMLPINKLYLVDSYEPYFDESNCKKMYTTEHTVYYDIAKKNLKEYRDKICFVLCDSINAAKDIPDELDFVYIDANHMYDFVKQDIVCWYKKIKKGGVLGGHNFCSYGVSKAVIEFVEDKKIGFEVYDDDWWIVV